MKSCSIYFLYALSGHFRCKNMTVSGLLCYDLRHCYTPAQYPDFISLKQRNQKKEPKKDPAKSRVKNRD
ncbi:hypothetical protein BVY11_08955 [Pseudomonas amygdali pv. morsprunorum]|nr:hypothetical protein BVY11_08955 [Pseudomonas amygdali pv. morsprunorum]